MLLAIKRKWHYISTKVEMKEDVMSAMRLQLALNVTDLEAAIDYYQRLFGVTVAKRKPGYANFEVAEPALKLVLFETEDGSDRLNHLGVETFADADVRAAAERQQAAGLDVDVQTAEACCFATQHKAVSYAPDGTMWEWYKKHDDLEHFDSNEAPAARPACC